MAKRRRKSNEFNRRRQSSSKSRAAQPGGDPPDPALEPAREDREVPKWIAAEGNLYWRGRIILHLAKHAHCERAILDEFEKRAWESPIPNPLQRKQFGDATSGRRNAVKNLNRHQGEIRFSSLRGGLMVWYAAHCAGRANLPGRVSSQEPRNND
jgi:hypothetical protein